jgi:hypothetical protein
MDNDGAVETGIAVTEDTHWYVRTWQGTKVRI